MIARLLDSELTLILAILAIGVLAQRACEGTP